MNLFLLVFFLLYGSLHLYAFVRMIRVFRLSRTSVNLLAIIICLASLSPVFVRLSEVHGYDKIALIIAWPGYIWMGFIFIFTVVLLTIDLGCMFARWRGKRRGTVVPEIFSPRLSFETGMLISIAATCYGLYEARNIGSERITISTDKVSAPTRIVQISDVHLGLLTREVRLKEMLKVVKDARPDILVSTGDLIDGRLSRQEDGEGFQKLESLLKAVDTPHGKFAVTGNHEYYAGLDHSIEVTQASGFKVLRNEYAVIVNGVIIGGTDDPAWKRMKLPPPAIEESAMLKSMPAEKYRIYLKHRPVVKDELTGLFDLQLSGHTHRGQIFPFYLLTKFQFPIPSGTTDMENGSRIHVSRGSGTWGPPIRLLAPPEVTIIDIVPK